MKWLGGLLIICSSLFSDITAIASDGDDLNSNISSKASRCSYYIFIDENGKTLEILQNLHKNIKGGASSKLIDMLNRKNVSHFIASSFGEKLIISLIFGTPFSGMFKNEEIVPQGTGLVIF